MALPNIFVFDNYVTILPPNFILYIFTACDLTLGIATLFATGTEHNKYHVVHSISISLSVTYVHTS